MNKLYEEIKKNVFVGYANLYLSQCEEESESDDNVDIQVHEKLVELDSRLGTTEAEQLWGCLGYSLRFDLIQV